MGDLVAAGVDDEPLDLPDVAVGGVDVIAAAHSYLSGGKGVVGGGRGSKSLRPRLYDSNWSLLFSGSTSLSCSGTVTSVGWSFSNCAVAQRSRIVPVVASASTRLRGQAGLGAGGR